MRRKTLEQQLKELKSALNEVTQFVDVKIMGKQPGDDQKKNGDAEPGIVNMLDVYKDTWDGIAGHLETIRQEVIQGQQFIDVDTIVKQLGYMRDMMSDFITHLSLGQLRPMFCSLARGDIYPVLTVHELDNWNHPNAIRRLKVRLVRAENLKDAVLLR